MDVLITLSDIRQYCKDVSTHLDDNAVNPYIIEAQVVELRNLLGVRFFNVFLSKIDEDRMQELLNGRTYQVDGVEINYQGLKPVIAYHAYARLVQKHAMQVTRFGLVQKESEYSSSIDAKAVATHATDARTTARVYEDDFRMFIEENKSTYPEWDARCKSDGPKSNKSIRISAIG